MFNHLRALYDGAMRTNKAAIRPALEVSLAVALLAAMAPPAQAVQLENASALQLAVEISARGVARWGCWAVHVVDASWTAPTDGGPVLWYHLEREGDGRGGIMQVLEFYAMPELREDGRWHVDLAWPALVDSCRARVSGVNLGPDGEERAGPWSEWSAWHQLGGAP